MQGWPIDKPDIIVSTPASLLNNIDPKRRRRLDFVRGVKYVVCFLSCNYVTHFGYLINENNCLVVYNNCQVFDEADMLLCGSFQNQVIRLINIFRFDEKQLSQMNESGAEKPMEKNYGSLTHANEEDEEHLQDEYISEKLENSDGDDDVEDVTEETESGSIKKKDWKRVRKIYQRSKQYIFVAATLPINGKKTAGAVLKHMFPDSVWISGNYLHCHNPRCNIQL